MSNSFCIPADCHQTLLYERLNNEMTPFLRVVCTDRNGVVTTRDYDLNGDNRSVIGEVLTEPDSRACCSHQIVLHEDLGNCTSAPFIREYSRGTDGALKIENFTLSGISIVPTGQIYTEPLAKTILSKEMCDAGRHETFLRWYASCATGVQTTFDTDTNGAPYTPGDAVYSGSCMCGTVVVKSEMCDFVSDTLIVKFIRESKIDDRGNVISFVDKKFDGTEIYVPSGTVSSCPSLPKENDTTITRQMCDRLNTFHKLPLRNANGDSGSHSWEVPHPVHGVITVTANHGRWTPWGYTLYEEHPTTFTFSIPLTADLRIFNRPTEVDQFLKLPDNLPFKGFSETYANRPDSYKNNNYCEWIEEAKSIRFKSVQEVAQFPGSTLHLTDLDQVSHVGFLALVGKDVTGISFNQGAGSNSGGTMALLQLWVETEVPFLRKTTYNSSGAEIGHVDTTLEGAPYSVLGKAIVCS